MVPTSLPELPKPSRTSGESQTPQFLHYNRNKNLTRYHSVGEVPGQVEMLPTSLPELPKPSRTSRESQKHVFQNPLFYIKIRETVFGHNSLPRRSQITILRHKLPIITPDLPIPARRQNSSVKPEYLNPKFLYKFLNFSFLISLLIPLKGPTRG